MECNLKMRRFLVGYNYFSAAVPLVIRAAFRSTGAAFSAFDFDLSTTAGMLASNAAPCADDLH